MTFEYDTFNATAAGAGAAAADAGAAGADGGAVAEPAWHAVITNASAASPTARNISERPVERRVELRVLDERLAQLARRLDPIRALRQEHAARAHAVDARILDTWRRAAAFLIRPHR